MSKTPNIPIQIKDVFKVVSELASYDVPGLLIIFSSPRALTDVGNGESVQLQMPQQRAVDHYDVNEDETTTGREEEIRQLMKLLDAHRKRLYTYLIQLATTGPTTAPPATLIDLSETRKQIQRIKRVLRSRGINVYDHFVDEED